jgi:hypothetical protein
LRGAAYRRRTGNHVDAVNGHLPEFRLDHTTPVDLVPRLAAQVFGTPFTPVEEAIYTVLPDGSRVEYVPPE